MEKKRLLLVDDSESDLFLLRRAFRKAELHYPLHELHSGLEAIAYLNGDGAYADRDKFPLPTAMILDLNMPKMSGFDVLRWKESQPELKGLPVFIMTSSVRPEDVERAFNLGANSFLVKPSTLEKLVEMVGVLGQWLELNRFPSVRDKMHP